MGPADSPSDPVAISVAAYSAHADAYEATYAERYAAIVARFAGMLPTPSLILDAGCGPGRDLVRFAAHGHVARGIDLNPEFVVKARRHAPTVHGDLRRVASYYLPGLFDGIWASASLVHLSTSELADVVDQFAALVRPGGKLFVSVSASGETGWWDEPDGRRWYTVWSLESLAEVVSAAGFTVVDGAPGRYVELWATRARGR